MDGGGGAGPLSRPGLSHHACRIRRDRDGRGRRSDDPANPSVQRRARHRRGRIPRRDARRRSSSASSSSTGCAPASSYMHAFGAVGRGLGTGPVPPLLARRAAAGQADDYGAYSFNETAARSGRFAKGDGRPSAIPDLTYAYHFDAGLYAAFLRRFAEARGVVRVEGEIGGVRQGRRKRRHRGARSWPTGGGSTGQLFIDCTGFRGLLIGEAMGSAITTGRISCRATARWRCRAKAARRFGPTPSRSRARGLAMAHPAAAPHRQRPRLLQQLHERRRGGGDCCWPTSRRGARRAAPAALHRPGGATSFWDGNCVALGLAAGFMEPLESTSIHLVQAGIARLLDHFPGAGHRACRRATSSTACRCSNGSASATSSCCTIRPMRRVGEPFWDACRAMAIPDTLAERIELFAATRADPPRA